MRGRVASPIHASSRLSEATPRHKTLCVGELVESKAVCSRRTRYRSGCSTPQPAGRPQRCSRMSSSTSCRRTPTRRLSGSQRAPIEVVAAVPGRRRPTPAASPIQPLLTRGDQVAGRRGDPEVSWVKTLLPDDGGGHTPMTFRDPNTRPRSRTAATPGPRTAPAPSRDTEAW